MNKQQLIDEVIKVIYENEYGEVRADNVQKLIIDIIDNMALSGDLTTGPTGPIGPTGATGPIGCLDLDIGTIIIEKPIEVIKYITVWRDRNIYTDVIIEKPIYIYKEKIIYVNNTPSKNVKRTFVPLNYQLQSPKLRENQLGYKKYKI